MNNDNKISISVIIPVYNAEKTIRRCVDSVLTQDFRDFELILVDDGSKDLSSQICDVYASKDNRIKVIHQANKGVSVARNRGLEEAKGEWITFIDSDDYIGEHFFHGVVDATEDLLLRGYVMSDEKGKEVVRFIPEEQKSQFSVISFIERFIGNPLLRGPVLKFYRRDIIGYLRFPEDMKVGEDTFFVWSYLAKIKTYKFLYYYYYYIITEISSEVKYCSTTAYSIRSLLQLKRAFEELYIQYKISKAKFFEFIGYFKLISKNEWKQNPSLWFGNSDVKDLYAYVWPDLTVVQRFRLIIVKMLRI